MAVELRRTQSIKFQESVLKSEGDPRKEVYGKTVSFVIFTALEQKCSKKSLKCSPS